MLKGLVLRSHSLLSLTYQFPAARSPVVGTDRNTHGITVWVVSGSRSPRRASTFLPARANARASWVLSKRSPDTYLIGMGRSP